MVDMKFPSGFHLLYLWILYALANASNDTIAKFRLLNGSDARLGQFPFVLAVLNHRKGVECTGALISPRFALTAAHCFDVRSLLETRWCMGGDIYASIKKPPPSRQLKKIERIVLHPEALRMQFELTIKTHLEYDFAVCKLKKSFTLSSNLQVIKIADEEPLTKYVTIAGFGRSNKKKSHGEPPLQYGRFILDEEHCSMVRKYFDTVYCITDPYKTISVGDSGGPLFLSAPDMPFTYIGTACCKSKLCGNCGIYSNAVASKEWILTVVNFGLNMMSNAFNIMLVVMVPRIF